MFKQYRVAAISLALLVVFVVGSAAWQKFSVHELSRAPLESYPLTNADVDAASSWLTRNGYSQATLRRQTISERTKRLAFITYRSCETSYWAKYIVFSDFF